MLLFIYCRSAGRMEGRLNSNTSHVIIYLPPAIYFLSHVSFKYISCYYLSKPVQEFIIKIGNSNTSHVIIYHVFEYSSYAGIGFEYISCYYLSFFRLLNSASMSYSNTSHVIIYQNRQTEN